MLSCVHACFYVYVMCIEVAKQGDLTCSLCMCLCKCVHSVFVLYVCVIHVFV